MDQYTTIRDVRRKLQRVIGEAESPEHPAAPKAGEPIIFRTAVCTDEKRLRKKLNPNTSTPMRRPDSADAAGR